MDLRNLIAMPRRREMKSVLHGFLGTFGSRYSDHQGYWIFGFVISDLTERTIDLLADDRDDGPAAFLARIARSTFRQQLEKHRLPVSVVRSAQLDLQRSNEADRGLGHHVSGEYELMMTARVTTDLGKTYSREMSIWVAPHNPSREHRSARWTQ
jgi:hypothetical protein